MMWTGEPLMYNCGTIMAKAQGWKSLKSYKNKSKDITTDI